VLKILNHENHEGHEMEERSQLFYEEVGKILDAAVEVHRVLGYSLLEKPYENALAREFALRGIRFVQQPRFPVEYKGVRVGEFVPDLIVFDSIIVDTKTIDRITDLEVGQMINYLRVTKLRVGFIINFKNHRLETRRVVL
jgi:GxxExxY protein